MEVLNLEFLALLLASPAVPEAGHCVREVAMCVRACVCVCVCVCMCVYLQSIKYTSPELLVLSRPVLEDGGTK